MLKLSMFLLSVAVSFSQPLTDDEIRSYMARVGETGIIEDIRRLDLIENAVPVFTIPEFGAVLEKNGSLTIWLLDVLMIDVAGILKYEVTIEPVQIKEFSPPEKKWYRWIVLPIGGCLAGLCGSLLAGSVKPLDYLVSGLAGIGFGILAGILIE